MTHVNPMLACGPSGGVMLIILALVVGGFAAAVLAGINLILIPLAAFGKRQPAFAAIHFAVALSYILPAIGLFVAHWFPWESPLTFLVGISPIACIGHCFFLAMTLRRISKQNAETHSESLSTT